MAGWQEVAAAGDSTANLVSTSSAGIRVKAGATGRNIIQNGDFDWDGCTGTVRPTGWSETGSPTYTFATGDTTQGVGCNVLVTDVGGGDDIRQTLSNLKGSTTYRVTAQVRESGADECTLSTSGAATQVTGMVSTSTTWTQLDGFFITASGLDAVTVILTNTTAGDICHWDHIGVYRQEAVEVPEAGIVAVYDTYTTSPGTSLTGSYTDVPELSITFVPPTEGWIIRVGADISVGCDDTDTDCASTANDGWKCQLEKGGSSLAGTVHEYLQGGAHTSTDIGAVINMNYIDINPAAGTSIVYTAACLEIGLEVEYNGGVNSTESNLWMMAYPPH